MNNLIRDHKAYKAEELLKKTDAAIELMVMNDISHKVVSMTEIQITHGKYTVTYFPGKDWWTGKWIGSGRHLTKLIKKLRPDEKVAVSWSHAK